MNEKNQNNQINGYNSNGQMAGTTTPPAQPGKFKAMINAASRRWTQFRYSRTGRILAGVTKIAVIGGAGYFGFKEGQKSVQPVTVHIEPVKVEAPADPATDNPTTEEPAETNAEV